jgi:hypothetical protein
MGLWLLLDSVAMGGIDEGLICSFGFHWRNGCFWRSPVNDHDANVEHNQHTTTTLPGSRNRNAKLAVSIALQSGPYHLEGKTRQTPKVND